MNMGYELYLVALVGSLVGADLGMRVASGMVSSHVHRARQWYSARHARMASEADAVANAMARRAL